MARYVKFPGTAGSYASTDDVNLLDCDSSWFAQGTGGLWTVGTPSTEQAWINTQSLKVLAGATTAITPATDAAFFSLYVYSAAGDTFDINGSTPVVAPAGVWTRIKEAGPDGTYTVTAVGAADYYIDGVIVQATDAAFVPSLRIVGDTDNRITFDFAALPVVATSYLFSQWGTSSMWRIAPLSSGAIRCSVMAGGSERSVNADVSGTVNGVHTLAFTRAVSDGAFTTTIDGIAIPNTPNSVASGAADIGSDQMRLGVNEANAGPMAFNGYSAERRDGIDGPIVAIFDADDVPAI